MPPSGYSTEQSRLVAAFLSSCADALVIETQHNHCSILEGLQKECRDIERALEAGWESPISRPVLALTGQFYSALLAYVRDKGEDFESARSKVLREVEAAVVSVHI